MAIQRFCGSSEGRARPSHSWLRAPAVGAAEWTWGTASRLHQVFTHCPKSSQSWSSRDHEQERMPCCGRGQAGLAETSDLVSQVRWAERKPSLMLLRHDSGVFSASKLRAHSSMWGESGQCPSRFLGLRTAGTGTGTVGSREGTELGSETCPWVPLKQ